MNNRSNSNTPKVSAKDFPHSGFDLSYKSRADFVLGRLHPINYQFIMPGDNFRFSTDVKHTFNTLVVPEISDVNVSLHSFYVPFRSIDTTFIDGMTPTELNAMSSTWRAPSFTLGSLVNILIDADPTGNLRTGLSSNQPQNWHTLLVALVESLRQYELASYQTFVDSWIDFINNSIPDRAFDFNDPSFVNVIDCLLTPLFGENSLLDTLGFHYFRRSDILLIVKKMREGIPFEEIPFAFANQCEYLIRAYYAIWYEHYRDKQVEKRKAELPDWRKFGSASIFQTESDLITFLAIRTRSWSKDLFTSSLPDDISRHVFAPIISTASKMSISSSTMNYEDAENNSSSIKPGTQGFSNLQFYDLNYIDPNSGTSKTIKCPIPKAVNDALNTLDLQLSEVNSYGLDLRDLRKSQMVERYLKRNFYFGDEYEDRMLAHYGSRISDNSIRRPHLLLSDTSTINPKQEISSISTSEAPAGTRTATAQDNTSGSTMSFYAEEFGVFITLLSVIPVAQYAGICPQNLISQMTDFPISEFANNNDETGRVCEIAQSPLSLNANRQYYQFGHYPYAHAWRSRVDEVHGTFLSERQDYTFRRFFGLDTDDTSPKLNYKFLHCIPNLGMFENTNRLDGQGYYTQNLHFYVERVLPTPTEEI